MKIMIALLMVISSTAYATPKVTKPVTCINIIHVLSGYGNPTIRNK